MRQSIQLSEKRSAEAVDHGLSLKATVVLTASFVLGGGYQREPQS